MERVREREREGERESGRERDFMEKLIKTSSYIFW